MDTAVQVTIAIFVLGVVFAAGRISSRLDALESWRTEVRGMFESINRRLGVLSGMDKREED